MKLAAIDIGSNAVRLLFQNVFLRDGTPRFYKDSIIRVPVRLGEQSFLEGRFDEDKIEQLVKTMSAFRLLIDVHRAEGWRTCATSAMRESANGSEAVRRIREQAGLNVEIISGKDEARIILGTHIENSYPLPGKDHLYIDVGGGSTELSFFRLGRLADSRSFKIGTLRLLNGMVSKAKWDAMQSWIEEKRRQTGKLCGVGSGGNINKLVKMYGGGNRTHLDLSQLEAASDHLKGMTLTERIVDLGLKPDRADVIVPAAKIFTHVMRWAGCQRVYAPKFGLADGIIRELYKEKTGAVPAGQEAH